MVPNLEMDLRAVSTPILLLRGVFCACGAETAACVTEKLLELPTPPLALKVTDVGD